MLGSLINLLRTEGRSRFAALLRSRSEAVGLGDPEHLEELMWRAYLLHLEQDDASAVDVLSRLTAREFDGNYDKWVWVEGGIVLQMFIGTADSETLKGRVLATLAHGGDEEKNRLKAKVFRRRTMGQLLDKGKIEAARQDGDSGLELLYSMTQLKELLFVLAFTELDRDATSALETRISALEMRSAEILSSFG